MNHTIVFPDEFITKLNTAYSKPEFKNKWASIGVNSVDDMLDKVISELNVRYHKLNIISHRIEKKDIIKEKIEIDGSNSVYAGYFETNGMKNEAIDGLFFYVEPEMGSSNDFLSRIITPTLLGIYKKSKDERIDRHINSRPVFIVNVCSTNRVTQTAVKKQIVCVETMGFNYIDIFKNQYRDVINEVDAQGNHVEQITSVEMLDRLISPTGGNIFFKLDVNNKKLILKEAKLKDSCNPSADIYRYIVYAIPAIYLASQEGYEIDSTDLASLPSGKLFDTLKDYIAMF